MQVTVVQYTVMSGEFIPTVIELHSVSDKIAFSSLVTHLIEFYHFDISIRIVANGVIAQDYDPLALWAVWSAQMERRYWRDRC